MILQPYGTTIALAVLVGAYVASVEARRRGLGSQIVWDALPWILVFGLVGARAYHVLHLWTFYRQNLEQVLFLWNGGLGIYGAILGGVVGLGTWKGLKGIKACLPAGRVIKTGELLDIAAPGLAIGQAIGRFANFFSQELYGFPTKMPWGVYIKPENRFPGLENFSYFQPLFLYEALWCLLGFVVLIRVGTLLRQGYGGQVLLTGERFLWYLSFYALGRFFLEGMRIESWMVAPLSGVRGVRVAQLLSISIIFGSISLGVFRRTWQKKQKVRI